MRNTTFDKERAIGVLAAISYLKGKKVKDEPVTLLKCPAKCPMSLLFRLFSKWNGVYLTKDGEVRNG